MTKVCLGCGSVLQTDNPKKQGYVEVLKEDGFLYCKRCFRLKHYHEMNMDVLSFSNEDLLKQANEYSCSKYYFVDFINLSAEAISWFQKLQGEKTLVLTKVDLIPFSISFEKLIQRIKDVYHISEKILVLSIKREKLLATLIHHMEKTRKTKFLFLGMTNVGKSSFLNALSMALSEEGVPSLISEMPNTTLSFLEWNMGAFSVIDAPGFNFLDANSQLLLKSVPKKYFKPITMQLKKETNLVFEDFLWLSQDLEKNSITFYGSNDLKLEKTYHKSLGDMCSCSISIDDETDLVLPGIGFFYVKKRCVLTLMASRIPRYELRSSMFGGHYDCN